MSDTQHKSINRTKIDRRIDKHFMQSYWSALHFAPTNLPVLYRGMPQASHGIISQVETTWPSIGVENYLAIWLSSTVGKKKTRQIIWRP